MYLVGFLIILGDNESYDQMRRRILIHFFAVSYEWGFVEGAGTKKY